MHKIVAKQAQIFCNTIGNFLFKSLEIIVTKNKSQQKNNMHAELKIWTSLKGFKCSFSKNICVLKYLIDVYCFLTTGLVSLYLHYNQ